MSQLSLRKHPDSTWRERQEIPTTAEGEQNKTSVAPPRVLIVDDETLIRELLGDYLREVGFECETAPSAEEAIIRLENDDFTLLVTDMAMPGIAGPGLLRYVAKNCRDMAVIVITAYHKLGRSVDSAKFAAFDYLSKPFDFETIVERINQTLERRGRAASPRV